MLQFLFSFPTISQQPNKRLIIYRIISLKVENLWTCNLVVVSNSNFLFVYRVKKNNATAITCLQSRDYSSSVPVRYIPKKSSKVNKAESPLPIKGSKNPSNRSDTMQRSIIFDEDKSRNHNQIFKDNVLLDDFERGM